MLAPIEFITFCLTLSHIKKKSKIRIYKCVSNFTCQFVWVWNLASHIEVCICENRMLRRTCGPKREEVAGDWRKLQNEELQNLYASQNIIRVIKPRSLRWTVHVACIG